MANIVAPELITSSKGDIESKKGVKSFYTCIYKFTRKEFQKLATSKVIATLFKNFVGGGHFSEMTKTDESLMRDPERYIRGAQTILEQFERAAGI